MTNKKLIALEQDQRMASVRQLSGLKTVDAKKNNYLCISNLTNRL